VLRSFAYSAQGDALRAAGDASLQSLRCSTRNANFFMLMPMRDCGPARRVAYSERIALLADQQALAEAETLAASRSAVASWVFATRASTPPRPDRTAKSFSRVTKAAQLRPSSAAQVQENLGEPSGIRTLDPLIKRPFERDLRGTFESQLVTLGHSYLCAMARASPGVALLRVMMAWN
jgi:hypothetical protein